MTKLESYRFDKSECRTCAHNTSNQVLFTDCAGECSGCQNRACMMRKNEEYIMQKALKMVRDDPRTMLAACVDTPSEILDKLEGDGYHMERLPNPLYSYTEAPEMPEAPNPSDYGSEAEYEADCNDYDAAMAEFTEQTQRLEFEVSEGRLRKYAILGTLDVEIRYEVIEEEEQEITVSDPDGSERKVFVTVVPPSPAETIRQQDRRNRELCYEHITSELKNLIPDVKVAKAPLRKEETQMFHYALMKHLREEFIHCCGIRTEDKNWIREEERYALAGTLTNKQRAALVRCYLLDFFRQYAPELQCTDDNLDTKLLCQIMDLNCEKESQAVQQKHLEVYNMRKERLQEQLDALQAQEDAVAREASAGEEPLLEPQEQPHEEPQPAVEDPQPTMFPVAPEQEPDTYQPEEQLLAA